MNGGTGAGVGLPPLPILKVIFNMAIHQIVATAQPPVITTLIYCRARKHPAIKHKPRIFLPYS